MGPDVRQTCVGETEKSQPRCVLVPLTGMRQVNAEVPMQISDIPFVITDWSKLAPTQHPGTQGMAYWRTCQFGAIRVRMVEYSAGYIADHWCSKGHILLCIRGELTTELQDGRRYVLTPGMSYQVADHDAPHRSSSAAGATLFIVD